jgi:hypothetical protein
MVNKQHMQGGVYAHRSRVAPPSPHLIVQWSMRSGDQVARNFARSQSINGSCQLMDPNIEAPNRRLLGKDKEIGLLFGAFKNRTT